MDASQLWETTMDPNTRILKQVKIDEDKIIRNGSDIYNTYGG